MPIPSEGNNLRDWIEEIMIEALGPPLRKILSETAAKMVTDEAAHAASRAVTALVARRLAEAVAGPGRPAVRP